MKPLEEKYRKNNLYDYRLGKDLIGTIPKELSIKE